MIRVMFYAQHLLGIGHLKRASLLAQGMVAAGLDVAVVLGGREVQGVDFPGCARVLLPAVHATDASFATLLDEHGTPIDEAWRDQRSSRLLFEYEALRPRVLIIELFPFGRRMFSFELLPLLSRARAGRRRPAIVCSLRDILVRKPDAERNRRTLSLAQGFFDRILVHGDPRLVPIDASFPEIAELGEKVQYTGYVVGPEDPSEALKDSPIGEGEVIVSVGGGAVGLPLLRMAIAAKPLSRLSDRIWRLITGPNLDDAAFAQLAWSAPPGVIIERWRSDLPSVLRSCAVSISQAGYNTVMDLLTAGTRAVLVPFADAAETEQTLRAGILAERGLVVTTAAEGLSPKILADAVDQALTLSPHSVEIDRSGVETTARLIAALARRAGK